MTYADQRLAGLDAVVLMEVIEHVDPPRLPALAHSVFHTAHPGAVIVTTPNSEYNIRYPALPPAATATPTTASSGPARSSKPGLPVSRTCTATPWSSAPSAPTTRT